MLRRSGNKKHNFQVVAQDNRKKAFYAISLALTTLFNDGGNINSILRSYLRGYTISVASKNRMFLCSQSTLSCIFENNMPLHRNRYRK